MILRTYRYIPYNEASAWGVTKWLTLFGETPNKVTAVLAATPTPQGDTEGTEGIEGVEEYAFYLRKDPMHRAVISRCSKSNVITFSIQSSKMRVEIRVDETCVKYVGVHNPRQFLQEYEVTVYPDFVILQHPKITEDLDPVRMSRKVNSADIRTIQMANCLAYYAMIRHNHPVFVHSLESGRVKLTTTKSFIEKDFQKPAKEIVTALGEEYCRLGVPFIITDSGLEVLL